MELTAKQQTVELIRQAARLLLIIRPSNDGDSFGSLVALAMILSKLGKDITLLFPGSIPEKFSFLSRQVNIQQNLATLGDLCISLDLAQAQVEKVSYRKGLEGKTLDILITPKEGAIPKEAIQITQKPHRFDLIIILDTPDLESLASLLDVHKDVFFETPIINIDHHPGNDYFGKVNWVDLTATSTAEILVSLIESLNSGQSLWDDKVATALLTGLTWDTQSFQSETTTPKSLTVAAQLIALGADQQEIVRTLFRTRSPSTLKLWGALLSNLNIDHENRFIWTEVGQDEQEETGAESCEAEALMDELAKVKADYDLALALIEESSKIVCLVRVLRKDINAAELARRLGGVRDVNRIILSYPRPLTEVRGKVLEVVKLFQKEQVKV